MASIDIGGNKMNTNINSSPDSRLFVDCIDLLDGTLLEIAALADLLATVLAQGQELPYRCKPIHPAIIAAVIEKKAAEAQSHSATISTILPRLNLGNTPH